MQNIIVGRNSQSQAKIYDTVGRMKKDCTLQQGEYIATKGYYAPGDGGHANYLIKESTDEEDGGSVITIDGAGLQAHLVHHGTVNIRQFGAHGDETHADTTIEAIQNAINFVPQHGRIYIPAGTYLISKGINISPPRGPNYPTNTKVIEIYGDGIASIVKAGCSMDKVLFSPTTADQVIKEKSRAVPNRHKFRDFRIDGNGMANYGFYAEAIANAIFEQIMVVHTKEAGIATGYGWGNRFYDCDVTSNRGDGFSHLIVNASEGNNANTYQGCMVYRNLGIGLNLRGGKNVVIRNCTIEENAKAGIFAGAIRGLSIVQNYFEANAETGISINGTAHKHDIILNGTYATDQFTYKTDANNKICLPGVVDISDNYVRVTRNYQPAVEADSWNALASFVYAPRIAGGDIKNNHLSGKNGYAVPLLMTLSEDANPWLLAMTLSGNYGFHDNICYVIP